MRAIDSKRGRGRVSSESLANLLAIPARSARRAKEALNHAQRLESVGQLTGGIAHDFNNLLTVIQGNLQVLEELPTLAGDDHGQQLVAAAFRATRRAAELTSKLLAFSRRQVLQPTAVDVGALLHSLADMLRRTLDQRIAIEESTCRFPLFPPCHADARPARVGLAQHRHQRPRRHAQRRRARVLVPKGRRAARSRELRMELRPGTAREAAEWLRPASPISDSECAGMSGRR